MITIATKLIKVVFKRILRHIYWLYTISKIKGIKNVSINFPVIVEGKGEIEIGEGSLMNFKAIIKIAKNASLNIGKGSFLDSQTEIRIGSGGQLIIGTNFGIENGSRIITKNKWQWGNNVTVATRCSIFSREHGIDGLLSIGNDTHIGDNSILDVTDDLTIGNEVAIGPNCTIYTHDHDYTHSGQAAWKGALIKQPVIIEDGAWIGCGVTILPGVIIGRRAIVAAGALVSKNVEPNSLVGGVPAKLLKNVKPGI